MNSVKPVLPQPGAPGVQSSPAKAAVPSSTLAGNLPTLGGSLVGQNLTQPIPPPLAPPVAPPAHAVPSMAPVSANMAQMAQNMSHHGNLSHVTQNSVAPVLAASPAKAATTSPLSLVQDKPNTPVPAQPLALTRAPAPEKKEPDSTGSPGQPNGTVDSPKAASNAPASLKPQNPEPNKDIDIAKTSPSTPKPPEKPAPAPSTPQKAEPAIANQAADPALPKVATANEAPEKSPAKPTEPKPAPTADVAPSQSDSKPVPESAKDSPCQEKALTPPKQDPPVTESAKVEPIKEEKKPEPAKVDKPAIKVVEEPKPAEEAPKKIETPKKEEKPAEVVEKVEEKVEEKKPEAKASANAKPEVKALSAVSTPKSTLKLATVTPPLRKRRHTSPAKSSDGPPAAKKHAAEPSTPDPRSKRNRTKVQLYQSPTPDIAMATKLSASAGRSTPTKQNDDKLIVFYKNEYLAVRNAEGGFYVCQATQNVYRTTRKIKIRWLSQDKSVDPSGETYKPDFYDVTDMECVLTTLSLTRAPAGGGAQVLKPAEQARAKSILERALQAEQGDAKPHVTEEHPDGLDLSLYTDESQLEKKGRKRTRSKSSPRTKPDSNITAKETPSPVKKTRSMPKRSPKRKSKPTPQKPQTKRKSAGTTPLVATASKTATAVTEKAKAKTPKRTPVKQKETPPPTPTRRGSRAAGRESKPSPIVPTPSTSTGKATRTPRKPPAKK